jgi:hypothetical protein
MSTEREIGSGIVSGSFTGPRRSSGIVGGAAPVGAGVTPNFTDHGGVIIPNVHLMLIFWGASWDATTANPTMGAVTDAVINILTGPYMNSLSQYRGIGSGPLQAAVLVSEAVGSSPATPPNNFTNTDIQTLLTNLIQAGRLPDPSTNAQLLYIVMLPPGATQPGLLGEHTYFTYNGRNLHYGWVANGGSLDSVTWVFSHELVESVTDPEGTAITGTGCNQGGWCEIGDVCTANTVRVNGVLVQRYWSQFDQQCVVPTDPIVKQDKDTKDTKDNKERKEAKEIKDHKPEHKEIKDAKEKDKDAKEKERPKELEKAAEGLDQLNAYVASLAQRIEQIAQRVGADVQEAQGQPFIQPGERPSVGDQALEGADTDHPPAG